MDDVQRILIRFLYKQSAFCTSVSGSSLSIHFTEVLNALKKVCTTARTMKVPVVKDKIAPKLSLCVSVDAIKKLLNLCNFSVSTVRTSDWDSAFLTF